MLTKLATLLSLVILLSGCAATMWGGKHQDTQLAMAKSNKEDTAKIMEAVKSIMNSNLSSDGKAGMTGMAFMAYQSKQFSNQFKATLPHSPVEDNWIQGIWAYVLGFGRGGGEDKTLIDKNKEVTTTTTTTNTSVIPMVVGP